jgi:hypothetical protein
MLFFVRWAGLQCDLKRMFGCPSSASWAEGSPRLRALRTYRRGIVHQHIEPIEGLFSSREEALHVLGFCDIAFDSNGPAAIRFDFSDTRSASSLAEE